MAVTFEVLTTRWGAGGDEKTEPLIFQGGVHVVGGECPCGDDHGKPTVAFLRLLAGADAAGAVRIDDPGSHAARLEKAVQSQADGEAAQAKAMGDWVEPVREQQPDGTTTLVAAGYWTGPWQHGNLAQAILDRERRLADAGKAERVTLERELADLRQRLDATEEPT